MVRVERRKSGHRRGIEIKNARIHITRDAIMHRFGFEFVAFVERRRTLRRARRS